MNALDLEAISSSMGTEAIEVATNTQHGWQRIFTVPSRSLPKLKTLEFVADVHISPVTIASLRQAEFKVTRITDSLPATATDSEIISFA